MRNATKRKIIDAWASVDQSHRDAIKQGLRPGQYTIKVTFPTLIGFDVSGAPIL